MHRSSLFDRGLTLQAGFFAWTLDVVVAIGMLLAWVAVVAYRADRSQNLGLAAALWPRGERRFLLPLLVIAGTTLALMVASARAAEAWHSVAGVLWIGLAGGTAGLWFSGDRRLGWLYAMVPSAIYLLVAGWDLNYFWLSGWLMLELMSFRFRRSDMTWGLRLTTPFLFSIVIMVLFGLQVAPTLGAGRNYVKKSDEPPLPLAPVAPPPMVLAAAEAAPFAPLDVEVPIQRSTRGNLAVVSNRVIGCRITRCQQPPYDLEIPSGDHPVIEGAFPERGLAYVAIRFGPGQPVRWGKSSTADQTDRLGPLGFFDAAGADALDAKVKKTRHLLGGSTIEELTLSGGTNAFAVDAYDRDGEAYFGFDDEDRPVLMVFDLFTRPAPKPRDVAGELATVDSSVEQNPEDIALRMRQCELRLQLGDHRGALRAAEAGLKDASGYLRRQLLELSAKAHARNGDRRAMERAFAHLLNRSDRPAPKKRGNWFSRKLGGTDGEMTEYEVRRIREQRAILRLQLGDLEGALEDALALEGGGNLAIDLAPRVLMRMNRVEEARELLPEPEPHAWVPTSRRMLLARLALEEATPELAGGHYRRAVMEMSVARANAWPAPMLEDLALVAKAIEARPSAVRALEAFIAEAPYDADHPRVAAAMLLKAGLLEKDDPEAAAQAIEAAAKKDPHGVGAALLIARTTTNRGVALRALDGALQQVHFSDEALLLRAQLTAEAGAHDAAQADLLRWLKQAPASHPRRRTAALLLNR